MWKKSDDEKPPFETALPPEAADTAFRKAPASAPPRTSASIGPSITIRGDITGGEDLVIHGNVEGSVNLPKNDISVGADGRVKANMQAMKIAIEGTVTGDLRASERVVIRSSGKVEGNITAPRVVLEDGCRFKGSVEMNYDTDEAQRSAAMKPAAKKPEPGKMPGMPGDDSKVVQASGAN